MCAERQGLLEGARPPLWLLLQPEHVPARVVIQLRLHASAFTAWLPNKTKPTTPACKQPRTDRNIFI